MFSGKLKSLMLSCVILLLCSTATVQLVGVSHLAYAFDTAVLEAIDDQLPTAEQVQELARINRLVARKALPAVVHIITRSAPPPRSNVPDSWRRFLDRPRQGVGSGVIVDAGEGFILTNNHVVEGATRIRVHLHDGRKYTAELVGHDAKTDLAVIRIPADQLFELRLGNSDMLEIGDPVMTIGNPFGMEGTVSQGIVSALNRSTPAAIIDYEGFIQTDAVINPGNSGGPLVNMRAEVVGLNTAIQTTTGVFNGIGLAIPSSRISRVLPTLLKGERVIRGYLGVRMEPVMESHQLAEALGWNESYGIIVDEVLEGSPAEEAGLQANDILVNWQGSPIRSMMQLRDDIAFTPPGDEAVFDVFRRRQMVSLRVIIGRQADDFFQQASNDEDSERETPDVVARSAELPALGLEVQTLDEPLSERFGLKDIPRGAVITSITPGSEAQQQNIHPGDVIVALNGRMVRDVEDLKSSLEEAEGQEPLDLRLRTAQGARHVSLRISY